MDINNRTLFFGDNLEILQEKIPPESFDLIYLDPPFNSNRNYNILFKEGKVDSSAQIHAFEDTWEWTDATFNLFEDLKKDTNPKIAMLMNSLWEFITPTPMMAYLVNMTARLIPLQQVLKPTGSLYLHCDPTASHYLKIILDVVFGKENFRNEIVWHYNTGGKGKTTFLKKHDIIFWYSKSNDYRFYAEAIALPRKVGTAHLRHGIDEKSREYYEDFSPRKSGKKYRWYLDEGLIPMDVWTDIQAINPAANERLGYPTQKPEELLERIIKTATVEGDWILDPFCGCGTTVAVAERLNRNWVGIDISMLAINVIAERLKAHFNGIKINIDGIPMDYESAVNLASRDKFAFQDWAISLVSANPPSGETRKGADRGIDGLILFYERAYQINNPRLRKVIVQVKGGHSSRGDVATLNSDVDREDAPMGVLITLNEPTSEMEREAALAGQYKYSETTSFPKIQLLSIKEWFDGKQIQLPTDKVNPFKRAAAKADQKSLF